MLYYRRKSALLWVNKVPGYHKGVTAGFSTKLYGILDIVNNMFILIPPVALSARIKY